MIYVVIQPEITIYPRRMSRIFFFCSNVVHKRMSTPEIMLRDMSDLDEIFPSCIKGEMFIIPILTWTGVTRSMSCAQ